MNIKILAVFILVGGILLSGCISDNGKNPTVPSTTQTDIKQPANGSITPVETEEPDKKTNEIVTSTEPVSATNKLKLVKTFGPSKLPEYGAKYGSGPSTTPVTQFIDFNINGITGKISMDSYRKANGNIQGNGNKNPFVVIVKALDNSGKEVSCKIDAETSECYYHKIALSGLGYYQASSDQTSNIKSITQWEVLVYTS